MQESAPAAVSNAFLVQGLYMMKEETHIQTFSPHWDAVPIRSAALRWFIGPEDEVANHDPASILRSYYVSLASGNLESNSATGASSGYTGFRDSLS